MPSLSFFLFIQRRYLVWMRTLALMNLRQLLSLYVVQSSSVLEGARKGGHIRWHILTTQAGQSSNARDGCLKTYDVSVTIDQSVLGVVPHVLDDPELSKVSALELTMGIFLPCESLAGPSGMILTISGN
ncbi:hypothetical protein BDV41DRAFT_25764 [Aspergillus transmontanensis]|uniref:Uncharacterized protein n=1 Tax=Aspergillus transmontanensis TaxID=1034304 RepID=A0A5N6VLC7_9EURO|nr:hypothetical protein BDV41DRAFT_25764 [Aspergillus transmontanensis]